MAESEADIFLKLDGIKGEVSDPSHKDEIAILLWNWSVKNTGSAHFGSGMGAGKMHADDLILEKRIDLATPALIRACATGKHIASGKLVARKSAGDTKLDYFTIELSDILISSIKTEAIDLQRTDLSDGDRQNGAREKLTLNFAQFKVTYTPQAQGGGGGAQAEFGYNIAQNKAV